MIISPFLVEIIDFACFPSPGRSIFDPRSTAKHVNLHEIAKKPQSVWGKRPFSCEFNLRISRFRPKFRLLGGRFRPIIRVLGHENEGLWLVVGGWAPTIGYSRRLQCDYDVPRILSGGCSFRRHNPLKPHLCVRAVPSEDAAVIALASEWLKKYSKTRFLTSFRPK